MELIKPSGDLEGITFEMFQMIASLSYEMHQRKTHFNTRPLVGVIKDEVTSKMFWRFFELKYGLDVIEIYTSDVFQVPEGMPLHQHLYDMFGHYGLMSVFINERAAIDILPPGSLTRSQTKYDLRPSFEYKYPKLYVSFGPHNIESLRLEILREGELVSPLGVE